MKVKLLERILTVLLLLIAVGALTIHPAQEISTDPLGGKIIDYLFNAVSYSILLYFIFSYWNGFLYVITIGPLQFFFLAIILFSLLWSEDLASSLLYLKGLIRIYLLAIYLVMRYPLKEQMRLFAWALGASTLLSLFFSAVMPGYIHTAPELAGMWSGIYGHKNELGYMMAWSAGLFMHLGLSIKRYRWLMWTICGMAVCVIVFSRSTTSLMILFAMVLLLPLYRILKKTNYKLQVIMIGLALLLVVSFAMLLMTNAGAIAGASGKDLTLSGRSDLWEIVGAKIWERPLQGYGFYAFWTSPAAAQLRATYDWASNAHNGFLELLLELGFLGFLTFAAGFIRCFVMALTRIMTVAQKPEDYWPMQALVIIVIINFSEARLLGPSWNWLMYLTTSLSLTLEYQSNQRKISLNQLSVSQTPVSN